MRGISLAPGRSTAHVIVTVEPKDGPPFFRTWKGSTIRGIRAAARKRYAEEHPGARVSFGNGWYTTSYGAH